MHQRLALLAAAALLAASAASAQQPAPPPPSFAAPNLSESGVRSLAAACSSCHGTNGRPAAGSTLPALAGKPRNELQAALLQFRDGKRPATVMQQLAKGYSDAEIAALADYFAKQPR